MNNNIVKALTFDDVLLEPQYSEVLPKDVSVETYITKKISLKKPFISAAMDTVTEEKMAIKMALEGGLGVIHKNNTPDEQSKIVKKVKEYLENNHNLKTENTSLDLKGRLLVAAACGPAENMNERVEKLVKAGVDILVVDTAHGHSKGVIETVKFIKRNFKEIGVIAGNIATKEAVKDLAEAGVDAVKVGIGPGSICTTRVVSGIGVPQLTAIINTTQEARKNNIYVIADGGIKYSGDIAKAISAGANAVMMGSLFAGTDEAPGEIIEKDGKKFKSYRGMGSLAAMKVGGKERYGQADVKNNEKLVPEGIEGIIKYKGSVSKILFQLEGGLRSSMGYQGASNLKELFEKAKFVQITAAGYLESHPHTVEITKEAPNYH